MEIELGNRRRKDRFNRKEKNEDELTTNRKLIVKTDEKGNKKIIVKKDVRKLWIFSRKRSGKSFKEDTRFALIPC
jgi:hypothetical protein